MQTTGIVTNSLKGEENEKDDIVHIYGNHMFSYSIQLILKLIELAKGCWIKTVQE